MARLDTAINSCLNKMSAVGGVGKGTYGEEAVFKICEQFYQTKGGILYHSYTYPTDPNEKGNIKRDPTTGKLYIEALSGNTEIDVLYVTKNNLFPIEVKAYKAKEIVLTNDGISGCFKVDKSPVHQNEMHCRHLYPALYPAIPNGESKYIRPIVVFVDKCKIIDKRSPAQKKYIKVTSLNLLKQTLEDMDVEWEYEINLKSLEQRLKNQCVKYEKFLPLREV